MLQGDKTHTILKGASGPDIELPESFALEYLGKTGTEFRT